MSGWTPGPWIADQCGVFAGNEDICDCGERAQWSGDSFHPFKNAKANARLISAAPDLYAALVAMLDEDDGGRAAGMARAAIAKADGGME